jgi:hypothetical protein
VTLWTIRELTSLPSSHSSHCLILSPLPLEHIAKVLRFNLNSEASSYGLISSQVFQAHRKGSHNSTKGARTWLSLSISTLPPTLFPTLNHLQQELGKPDCNSLQLSISGHQVSPSELDQHIKSREFAVNTPFEHISWFPRRLKESKTESDSSVSSRNSAIIGSFAPCQTVSSRKPTQGSQKSTSL